MDCCCGGFGVVVDWLWCWVGVWLGGVDDVGVFCDGWYVGGLGFVDCVIDGIGVF